MPLFLSLHSNTSSHKPLYEEKYIVSTLATLEVMMPFLVIPSSLIIWSFLIVFRIVWVCSGCLPFFWHYYCPSCVIHSINIHYNFKFLCPSKYLKRKRKKKKKEKISRCKRIYVLFTPTYIEEHLALFLLFLYFIALLYDNNELIVGFIIPPVELAFFFQWCNCHSGTMNTFF